MEQLDNSYHPVLSYHSDIPLSVCLESSIRHQEHSSASVNPPHHIRRSSFQHSKKLRTPRSKLAPAAAGRTSPVAPIVRAAKRANNLHAHSANAPPLTPTPTSQRKSTDGARRPKGISLTADSSSTSSTRTPIRRSAESGQNTPTASTPSAAAAAAPASLSRQQSQSATRRQKRGNSSSPYDIHSIVVPLAAPSRVEKINYKEIATPRWRVCDVFAEDEPMVIDDDVEDISDEMFAKRHETLEAAERIRFQGADKKRRTNRASSSLPTTPEATLTAPTSPMCNSQSLRSSPGDAARAPSLTVAGSQDDASQAAGNVSCRKSSRKTPSLSRSTSSLGEEPMPCCFVVPWDERVFPLTDAEMHRLQMEEQCSQQLSNVTTALNEHASLMSLPESASVSLAASRVSSNPSSPCAPSGCDTVQSSNAKLPQSLATNTADSWCARLPSPKAKGKEVEEKKPPLLLKLTKQPSSSG
eukprot:scpid36428/ scgid8976/ KAT8 regulatory NSL complex subunit 1-like protein